jgi:hypothetical protein
MQSAVWWPIPVLGEGRVTNGVGRGKRLWSDSGVSEEQLTTINKFQRILNVNMLIIRREMTNYFRGVSTMTTDATWTSFSGFWIWLRWMNRVGWDTRGKEGSVNARRCTKAHEGHKKSRALQINLFTCWFTDERKRYIHCIILGLQIYRFLHCLAEYEMRGCVF